MGGWFIRIGLVLFILAGGVLIGLLIHRLGDNPAPRTETVSRAQQAADLYEQSCFVCHGSAGDGQGPAAGVLDPRPRNFRLGKYRLLSATNGVPYKEDLIRTIRNGMAGTSMPAWPHFTDDEVEMLVEHIQGFTRKGLEAQLSAKVKPQQLPKVIEARMKASGRIEIPEQPAPSPTGLARGKELFDQVCAKCHNVDGSGRQDPQWKTEDGHPIASRNFTSKVFKGGGSAADLYMRIYAGMPGTPMPSFASLPAGDIWAIVHYTQTLADPKTRPAAALAAAGARNSNDE